MSTSRAAMARATRSRTCSRSWASACTAASNGSRQLSRSAPKERSSSSRFSKGAVSASKTRTILKYCASAAFQASM
jgi:hypothetical protein